MLEIEELRVRINKAVGVAEDYAVIDGAHHKQWVIDQMVRALLADFYDEWHEIQTSCDCEFDGECEYSHEWDQGIAP